MQSWKTTAVALLLAALLATTVQTPASADGSQAPGRVGVMTLNMYIGADLGPLSAVENPKDLPGVVAEVWELGFACTHSSDCACSSTMSQTRFVASSLSPPPRLKV